MIHYKFQKGKLETVNQIQIKNGDGQKPEKALGITSKELDQAKFGWKELETGKKATSQASTSEQQTSSFQVRVGVSDLRIRKEASINGEEVGMIPQGVYTITETVSADGYTWGKLQSGQGWIALEFTTRVSGNAESAPAPANTKTGMNLEEIKAGNFSSVAGVWKNKHGTSIEFDAQGIVKVNGSDLSGVQFSDFYFKEGNLHGLSRIPGATNETPILFIPSREGGSESIYWSRSDVTNGNDLYYRVN